MLQEVLPANLRNGSHLEAICLQECPILAFFVSLYVLNRQGVISGSLTICSELRSDEFLSSLSLFEKEPVCPDRWVLHVESCFPVIDIPTLERSDARRNCQKLGEDLAKITSASENQFISDLVTKQTKVTFFGARIGLHRKADNNFY